MKKVLVSTIALILVLQILLPQHRINTAYAMDDVDQFYYELLNEKILYNGIYEYNSDNYEEHGVVYTKFFDLNNNGIDDLYILTLEKGLYDSPYGNYVEEIYIDGKLIDSIESSGPGSGLVGDNSRAVYITDQEILLKSSSSYSVGGGRTDKWWINQLGMYSEYITSYMEKNNKTTYMFSVDEYLFSYSMLEEVYYSGESLSEKEIEILQKGKPENDEELVIFEYF